MGQDSVMRVVPEPASMGDAQVLSEMVLVTPSLAQDILENQNDGNRNLNEAKVRKYTDDMRADNWRGDNGESIKFDTNNKLMNGQHRLSAVDRSGVSLMMEFRTGLDPDTRVTIDTGKPRSGGDVLAMTFGLAAGDSHAVARALNLLSQYEAGESLVLGGKNTLSTSALQEMYLDREVELMVALEFTKEKLPGKKERLLGHGDQIFLALLFIDAGGEHGELFLQRVLKGECLEPNTNESLARSYLLARALPSKKSPVHIALNTIIRAWNYAIMGKVYATAGNMTYVPGNKPPRASKR